MINLKYNDVSEYITLEKPSILDVEQRLDRLDGVNRTMLGIEFPEHIINIAGGGWHKRVILTFCNSIRMGPGYIGTLIDPEYLNTDAEILISVGPHYNAEPLNRTVPKEYALRAIKDYLEHKSFAKEFVWQGKLDAVRRD